MENSVIRQEEIYLEYRDKVRSYVRSRISNIDDIEDLISSIFLKVYSGLETYDSAKAGIGTWIYTITHNTVLDYYRDKTRNKKSIPYDEIELVADDTLLPDESILNEEVLEELAAALEKLPQRERDILILRFYHDYEPRKIAELMNISYSNVRYLQSMAIKKLRIIL